MTGEQFFDSIISLASAFWDFPNEEPRMVVASRERLVVPIPPTMNWKAIESGYIPESPMFEKEEIEINTQIGDWLVGYGPKTNVLAIMRNS